jgi:murein DD-endopeptidase MepM/ murein hydrolase activator NlpD
MIKTAITNIVNKLMPKKIILTDTWKQDGWKCTQAYGDTEYSRQLEKDFQDGKYENRVYPYILHIGEDYAGKKEGFPIRAMHDGQIMFSGFNDKKRARGMYISIWDLQQDIATIYLHLSNIKINIRKNVFVKAGDIIGYVGDTGWCEGVHCHVGLYLCKDGYILKSLPYGGSVDIHDKKLVRLVS